MTAAAAEGSPSRLSLRSRLASLAREERARAAWLLSDSAGGAFAWFLAGPSTRRRAVFLGAPGAGAVDGLLRFASGAAVTSDPAAADLARSLFLEAGRGSFRVIAPEGPRVPLPDACADAVIVGPGAPALGVDVAGETRRLLAEGGVLVAEAERRALLAPFCAPPRDDPGRVKLAQLPRGLRTLPLEPGRRGPIAIRGLGPRARAPRGRLFRETLLSRLPLARLVVATDARRTPVDAIAERYPPSSPALEITPTGLLAWFAPGVRVEVPLTRAASARARRSAERLAAIASREGTLGPAAALAPRLVVRGDEAGVEFFAESLRPGVTLESLANRDLSAARAIDLLADLHRRTARPVALSREEIERRVRRPVLDLLGFAAAEEGVRKLARLLARRLEGRTIALVLAHGDFGPQNVLVGGVDGDVTGILDWDLADDEGVPFADAAHLAARLAGLPLDRWREAGHALVERYVAAFPVEEDLRDAFVALLFVRARRAHLDGDRPYDPEWVRVEFAEPVARLVTNLEASSR